jgi:hypothetical protein
MLDRLPVASIRHLHEALVPITQVPWRRASMLRDNLRYLAIQPPISPDELGEQRLTRSVHRACLAGRPSGVATTAWPSPKDWSMGSWRTLPPWPRARGDVFDHHQRDR